MVTPALVHAHATIPVYSLNKHAISILNDYGIGLYIITFYN